MAVLVTAIHVFFAKHVDTRDKPADDEPQGRLAQPY